MARRRRLAAERIAKQLMSDDPELAYEGEWVQVGLIKKPKTPEPVVHRCKCGVVTDRPRKYCTHPDRWSAYEQARGNNLFTQGIRTPEVISQTREYKRSQRRRSRQEAS